MSEKYKLLCSLIILAGSGFATTTNQVMFANVLSVDENAFLVKQHIVGSNEKFSNSYSVNKEDALMVTITSGRENSQNVNKWLFERNYIFAPDYPMNFALIGDFRFQFKGDNRIYTCNNVAIDQYKHGLRNEWSFLSNILPGFSVNARDKETEGLINCTNFEQDRVLFKIKSTGSVNKFDIEMAHQNPKVFDDTDFSVLFADTYNNLPIDKKALLANEGINVHQLTRGKNFFIEIPADIHGTGVVTANQVGEVINGEVENIYVGQKDLINNSDIQQNLTTDSFSMQIMNSTTTTNTNAWGGRLAITNEGKFDFGVLGAKTMVTVEVSYSNMQGKSITTSNTLTYTASPQTISTPPRSVAHVVVTMKKQAYSGKFKFDQMITGVSKVDGVLVNLDGTLTKKNVSIPIYETLLAGDFSNAHVKLNSDKNQVSVLGSGVFTGVAGTNFSVDVSITPLAHTNLTSGVQNKSRNLNLVGDNKAAPHFEYAIEPIITNN